MNNQKQSINVVGVMSGTSLDGVDLAFCSFILDNDIWKFELIKSITIPYPDAWLNRLKGANELKTTDFIILHKEYGYYLGQLVNDFIIQNKLLVDLVCSHGHTVFHEPEINITFQIGDGNYIAEKCKKTVVYDFRTMDIAHNGHGAPLVPIGDELLFGNYDFCLNLGGFSNISYKINGDRIAYDISPCNLVLNELANLLGFEYDNNGEISKSGKTDTDLLNQLNKLEYYKQQPPKSLGTEWLNKELKPIIANHEASTENKLRTVVEHIAIQIANAVNPIAKSKTQQLFITGGGALNSFMVERINKHCNCEVVIPAKEIINFKEAIIFAFLGVLRINNQVNCLKTVTGAYRDTIGGVVCKY